MSHKNFIKLPECGMFIGSPVYLDRADYIFQHSGLYYTSWVSEDHSPEWYLEKIKSDNQGNLAIIWDGGVTRSCLKTMADWLDLESIGYSVPEPDWENGKFLQPSDWPVIGEHMDRDGAGFYRWTQKVARLGLHTYSIYADATPEWAEKISSEPAFIGVNIGEVFSFDIETDKKAEFREEKIQIDTSVNLKVIADRFAAKIGDYFIGRKKTGWKRFLITSASFHLDFEIAAAEAPVIPHIEGFAFANLNFGMSLCRGIYKQYQLPLWGEYLAHEHYAFLPYRSKYRFKTLDAAFLLSYMNGSKITVLESGNWWQQSDHVDDTPMHETPKIDLGPISNKHPNSYAQLVPEARRHYPKINYTSTACRKYRRCLSNFYDFVKTNGTPEGQPEINIAAIKGRYDFCSQQFSPNQAIASAYKIAEQNPLWYEGQPERSWEIFRKVFYPLNNILGQYNNLYLSGTPYGMTDIVSFSGGAPDLALLRKYRALVFTGWNSASEKQYELLKKYVYDGGILFASIAHFSKNLNRNYVAYDVDELINHGDFTELCGVKVKKRGTQLYWVLASENNKLGLDRHERFGPFYSHMGELEITGNPHVAAVHDESFSPFLLINNYGKGKVYFLNSWEYPGALDVNLAPGASRLSKGLVGEIYKTIANETRGAVYISDAGRAPGKNCEYITFSYFPLSKTICLLNIDFNRERRFFIHYNEKQELITLKAGEFRLINF